MPYVNGDPLNYIDRRGLRADDPENEEPDCYFNGMGVDQGTCYFFAGGGGERGGGTQDGGGAGGGKPYDPTTLLPGMRSRAISAAQTHLDPGDRRNVDCISLFSAGGKGLDPADLLAKLDAGNTPYGVITYGTVEDPNFYATTTVLINTPDSVVWVGALVTLNKSVSGAWWTGTDEDRATTVLHELVHAYEVIWGSAPVGWQDERSAKTAEDRTAMSIHNQNMIKENCFK